jgi:2-C-methyl-D-erythritol 4-phosphate cytidylyltransferase
VAGEQSNDTGDLLGIVPAVGRGDLVHERLGSQTLLDRAVDMLSMLASAVAVVAEAADADSLSARLGGFDRAIIHDPLCPLVSERFARRLLAEHRAQGGRPIVAVRPVIDTIKAAPGGVVAQTVDRDGLRVVVSPIVVSARDLLSANELGASLTDPSVLVARLRAVSTPDLVTAPAAVRRVEDRSGLRLVAAIEAAHLAHPVSG